MDLALSSLISYSVDAAYVACAFLSYYERYYGVNRRTVRGRSIEFLHLPFSIHSKKRMLRQFSGHVRMKCSASRAPSIVRLHRPRQAWRGRMSCVASSDVRVTFRVHHHVRYGERLGILGSHYVLGSWRKDKTVPLKWTEGDVWFMDCSLETTCVALPFRLIK